MEPQVQRPRGMNKHRVIRKLTENHKSCLEQRVSRRRQAVDVGRGSHAGS